MEAAGEDATLDGAVTTDDEAAPNVGIVRRVATWCGQHPLVIAGIIGGVVAVANAIWIWQTRLLGGFDPDESSYLSSSLMMQRSIDLRHPAQFVTTVLGTGHGIAVPVLSVPLLIVGPRDPRTAMLLQPILLVFVAVATAGITLRLTRRPLPAVIAATWVAILPTMTTAVQSYWYGLGAAAGMTGAMWALLASDRGMNRRIWWYSVGIAVMLLSRTMTLGYLPACGVAALVVAWPDRAAIKRVTLAFGLGVGLAAPWYIANARSIFGYLFSFGYTGKATEFGESGIRDRVGLRTARMVLGMGIRWLWPIVVIGLIVVVVQLVRRKRLPALEPRGFAAIGAVVVLGTLSLISTANSGVWFELPLVVLTVVLLVSAAAQLPKPVELTLAFTVLFVALSAMPAALWLTDWKPGIDGSHYEWGFAEYDERFRPDRRDEHEQAAADWWALSNQVEQEMRQISPDGQRTMFLTTGNTHLYNANVVRMAAEMDGWNPYIVIPDTTLPPKERAKWLGAAGLKKAGLKPRVLIVGIHDQILWPLDVETRSLLAQAKAMGFVETARFKMPTGGYVAMFQRAVNP